jgi:hypothetical protein
MLTGTGSILQINSSVKRARYTYSSENAPAHPWQALRAQIELVSNPFPIYCAFHKSCKNFFCDRGPLDARACSFVTVAGKGHGVARGVKRSRRARRVRVMRAGA